MSTTWPVHIKTDQVQSSAWFFKIEKKKNKKKNSYLLSCFFLTKLIVFNLSAVELTPHHVFSYKTRSVSCFKIIKAKQSS